MRKRTWFKILGVLTILNGLLFVADSTLSPLTIVINQIFLGVGAVLAIIGLIILIVFG